MKRAHLFFIYLICFVLQITVVEHLTILGGAPQLILVLTIVFSFFYEDFNGVAFGVLFGLLLDICTGPAAGISALSLFLIGIGLQFVRFAVYRDNFLIMLLITAICTAFFYAAVWVTAVTLLEYNISFMYAMMRVPAAIIWNFIAVMIACHFARRTKGFTV